MSTKVRPVLRWFGVLVSLTYYKTQIQIEKKSIDLRMFMDGSLGSKLLGRIIRHSTEFDLFLPLNHAS